MTILEGSSQFTSIRMLSQRPSQIDACNASCPHSYRLQSEIEKPTVPVLAVSGGGKITTTQGFAGQPRLTAAVNGGGEIDATRLGLPMLRLSSGQRRRRVKVRAVEVLTAAVNGGGAIRYWGDPPVTTAISGGGGQAGPLTGGSSTTSTFSFRNSSRPS